MAKFFSALVGATFLAICCIVFAIFLGVCIGYVQTGYEWVQ